MGTAAIMIRGLRIGLSLVHCSLYQTELRHRKSIGRARSNGPIRPPISRFVTRKLLENYLIRGDHPCSNRHDLVVNPMIFANHTIRWRAVRGELR